PMPGARDGTGAGSTDWVQGGLWSDLKAEPKKSEEDDLLDQAIRIVQDNERVSISLLQRKLRIGYSRAARLMELLIEKGMVGEEGLPTKGREVLKGNLPSGAPLPPPNKSNGAPSGIIRTPSAPNKTSPRANGDLPNKRAASSTPKNSGPPLARDDRTFEGDDLGDFDEWTDEDWEDLNKGD